MMEYETFKQMVSVRIKDMLPPVFGSFDVKFLQVQKVNGAKEAMVMLPGNGQACGITPNIYMDDMYQQFAQTGDLEAVLEQIAAMILCFTGAPVPEVGQMDLKEMVDRIVPTMVNKARNRQMLEAVPHYEILDLSVVFRFIIQREDEQGFMTSLVTNELLEYLELTPEEVRAVAMENMEKVLPVKVLELTDSLSVLTNDAYLYGAAGLLRPQVLAQLAEKMQADLYLVPSSIHEIMVMPTETSDFQELLGILENGNRMYTDAGEFLSDEIYYYQKDTGEIRMAQVKE